MDFVLNDLDGGSVTGQFSTDDDGVRRVYIRDADGSHARMTHRQFKTLIAIGLSMAMQESASDATSNMAEPETA